jgi:methylamine---glutamate N-methyltransferase subunit C
LLVCIAHHSDNVTTKKAQVKGMLCPLLIRARKVLQDRKDISLVITGGPRVFSDFAKAFAMGADAVAMGTEALSALGCQQYRVRNTGRCPV